MIGLPSASSSSPFLLTITSGGAKSSSSFLRTSLVLTICSSATLTCSLVALTGSPSFAYLTYASVAATGFPLSSTIGLPSASASCPLSLIITIGFSSFISSLTTSDALAICSSAFLFCSIVTLTGSPFLAYLTYASVAATGLPDSSTIGLPSTSAS